MDIVKTCPLGSDCQKIEDNKIQRCRWYVELGGKDPTSGKDINRWECAIAWLPTLSIEIAMTNRGTTQAVESSRNEVAKSHQFLNMLLSKGLQAIGNGKRTIPAPTGRKGP